MSVALSAWIGAPGPLLDVESTHLLTYTQLALVVVWALLATRGRLGALLGGIVFAVTSVGWWILVFDRPYGVYVDPVATRWAADLAVAAESGVPSEGFVSGTPSAAGWWAEIAARGVPAPVLLGLTLFAPALALVLTALALGAMRPGRAGATGAVLWLCFSTSPLESLRGAGFVDGAWGRPVAAGLLALGAWLVVLVGRRHPAWGGLAGLSCVLAAGAAAPVASVPAVSFLDVVLASSLDRLPWLLLAAWSLHRRRDQPVAVGLLLAGGVGLVACLLLGLDPWAALGLARMGLVAAAARPLAAWLRWLDRRWRGRWSRLRGARQLALPALLAVCLPGSFLVLWRPYELDPVALASVSRPAWSPNEDRALAWIRDETPVRSVIATSREKAAVVAVEARRRVLRAPDVVTTDDASRRVRLERRLMEGESHAGLLRRYGVGWVLAAPGGTWEQRQPEGWRPETVHPWVVAALPNLRIRYEGPGGFTVCEILPGAPSPDGSREP